MQRISKAEISLNLWVQPSSSQANGRGCRLDGQIRFYQKHITDTRKLAQQAHTAMAWRPRARAICRILLDSMAAIDTIATKEKKITFLCQCRRSLERQGLPCGREARPPTPPWTRPTDLQIRRVEKLQGTFIGTLIRYDSNNTMPWQWPDYIKNQHKPGRIPWRWRRRCACSAPSPCSGAVAEGSV